MTIYALIDPRTNRIRYVGRTIDPARRLKAHVNSTARAEQRYPVKLWIKLLQTLGLRPRMVILETCDGDGCTEERYHIALARADGIELLNCTDGGDGTLNPTAETRRRMSMAKLGRKMPPAQAAKIGASNTGRYVSQETREKIRKSQLARDPALNRKCWVAAAAANRGRKHSAEEIAKRAASLRGRPCSPEVREKIGAAHRGKKLSEAHRAALRAGQAKPSAKVSAIKRRAITVEREPEFIADCLAGMTTGHLKRKYGLSYGCIRKHCWRLSLSPPQNRRRGEQNHLSKLTADAVRQIRLLRQAGETMTAIGAKFGVTRLPIRQILTGKTWRHVV